MKRYVYITSITSNNFSFNNDMLQKCLFISLLVLISLFVHTRIFSISATILKQHTAITFKVANAA